LGLRLYALAGLKGWFNQRDKGREEATTGLQYYPRRSKYRRIDSIEKFAIRCDSIPIRVRCDSTSLDCLDFCATSSNRSATRSGRRIVRNRRHVRRRSLPVDPAAIESLESRIKRSSHDEHSRTAQEGSGTASLSSVRGILPGCMEEVTKRPLQGGWNEFSKLPTCGISCMDMPCTRD